MASSNPYFKKSMEELVAIQSAIMADPNNKQTTGSGIQIYSDKARRKLGLIAYAINSKLMQADAVLPEREET